MGAGALHGEEALLGAHATRAATGGAGDRLRSCFGAAAFAGLAGAECLDADLRVAALEGFFECDLEVVAKIAAARGTAAAPAAIVHRAEHFLENVGEPTEAAAAASAASALLERGMAEAVVGGALLLVLQDLIGFGRVLEFLLGGFVARIAIRMMLHGQLPVRLLDIVGRGLARQSQQFIEVLLRHRRNPLSPKPR